MHVAICGGGVIGACTAYFLARRGVGVTVVERSEVACAASGNAGGFLALDLCGDGPLDALARRSFALHAQLADEIDKDWGYHRTNAYGGSVVRDSDSRRHAPAALDWLADGIAVSHRLGTTDTTAVVNPRKFTRAMMHAAQQHGAQVRLGAVTGLTLLPPQGEGRDGGGVAVDVDGAELEADAVVIAMGPWSKLAAQWLPLPEVFGQQSPSLVYDTGADVPGDALFLEYRDASGNEITVEVFPRADGTTHVCAFSGEAPLPLDPADVEPEADVMERLRALCERLSPAFTQDRIIARQACFRPLTRDFLPLIGAVPHTDGAFIATGHNVWGILNGPATGEAMAELIVEGKASTVELKAFDPARLPAARAGRSLR